MVAILNLISYLPLLAGIGLFLYGMNLLGKSLERMAGAKLEKTLEKLTDNIFKGVLLGTGVTAVIQSSAATTIMVVGLLNAGIMKLSQALPVIMGANIGTTVTGQLLRLGDISESNFFLSLLKPSSFGPILIAVGAFLIIFSKVHSRKTWGNLLIGLGMLFFGMNTMEITLSPLGEQPWFQNLLVMFQNPLLGIFVGFLVTALLQSSSASIGILQALSITGVLTYSNMIPLVLGQNIGSCIPVLLAAIGTSKNSKRAVFMHLTFNILGTLFFIIGIYGGDLLFHFSFWDTAVTRGNIADFHTLFNIITVLALLPFCKQFVRMSQCFIKDNESPTANSAAGEAELARLDDLFLSTPSLALNQARKVVIEMGNTALASFDLARKLHLHYSQEDAAQLERMEDFMDRAENTLNNYILKITPHRLSNAENNMSTEMLHAIGNFERIGDHCINILDVARYNAENNVTYSETGWKELNTIMDATHEVLEVTARMYANNDPEEASHVEPYEDVIDSLQARLKDRHIERLRLGLCNVSSGISFLEILTSLERISDHCSNIALNIIQMNSKDYTNFAYHSHVSNGPKLSDSPEFKVHTEYFRHKYELPEDQEILRLKAQEQALAKAETVMDEAPPVTEKEQKAIKKKKKNKKEKSE